MDGEKNDELEEIHTPDEPGGSISYIILHCVRVIGLLKAMTMT